MQTDLEQHAKRCGRYMVDYSLSDLSDDEIEAEQRKYNELLLNEGKTPTYKHSGFCGGFP